MLKRASFIPLRHTFGRRNLAPLGLLVLVLGVGGFGIYQSRQQPGPASAATPAKLEPYSLGFAPYAYLPYSTDLIDNIRATTGVKQYVVAFINSAGSCTPTWDNDATLGLGSTRGNAIGADIAKLRTNGGDVTLSFGGEGGNELANYCTDVTSLKAAYRSVIDKYNLTRVDFDIEGTNASQTAANLRRAQAVASLKQDLPGLKVYLTIQTDTSIGLDPAGKVIAEQMRDAGVPLAGINIMTMIFGTGTDDGAATISAAKAAFTTLKSMYPSNTDAEIWQSLDLTALIGVAYGGGETYTLANAQTVRSWAQAQKIGMLTMWNVARDQPCAGTAHNLTDETCSGVTQTPYQYMSILNMPASTNTATPAPTATPVATPTPIANPSDINKDGLVNVFDLSTLLTNWNLTGTNAADINKDNVVNVFDLSVLLSHWTK
jgi:hypothetical protein